MKKEKFTLEQREEIARNINVHRCGAASVTFTKEFKLLAVKQYTEEGLSARQIFIQAGLDLKLLGKYVPKNRLRDWNRIYRSKQNSDFSEIRGKNSQGGGRPKTKGITDSDKIERLEAEVAYLKAENSFLAKLRAKRRE